VWRERELVGRGLAELVRQKDRLPARERGQAFRVLGPESLVQQTDRRLAERGRVPALGSLAS
jgi:hypothetical protein